MLLMLFIQLQDHPRLCGEKSGVRINFLSDQGSPPPMRGKEMNLFLLLR